MALTPLSLVPSGGAGDGPRAGERPASPSVPARYLALLLPSFRLERCGYAADEPAALLAEERNAVRLVALTPAALALGLRQGMAAPEARALQPEVRLEPLDAAGEEEDFTALVDVFGAFADRVMRAGPEALLMEISRVLRLHGGEEALVARLRSRCEQLGHSHRVGVADDPLAALALARFGAQPLSLAPRGESASWLAPLPLAALDPSPSLLEQLSRVGIETIGEWAALDPASVAGRYGEEGVRLHRVARGRVAGAPVVTPVPLALPTVETPLAGATSLLQLQFVLPGLLADLADQLAHRDLVVAQLLVVLVLDRGPRKSAEVPDRVAFPVRVGRPTRRPSSLELLLRRRLEGIRLSAPVDRLRLEVTEAAVEQGWQPGLTDRAEQQEPLPDLLARLADQLGNEALIAPCLQEAWRPESAWAAERYPSPRAFRLATPPPAHRARAATDPVEVQRAWEQAEQPARPARLLSEPRSIDVRVVEDRPWRVQWGATPCPVRRAAGPERLSGGWWCEESAFARAYWVVQLADQTAWIFLDELTGAWFLHGWFD